MAPLLIPIVIALGPQVATTQYDSEPVVVKYAANVVGRQVTVTLDGKKKTTMFAGKLGFQDAGSSWATVCGEVREPIDTGRFFAVQPASSKALGGNIEKAGNIVASNFVKAKTADQCAGLQIAVWEAVEDGNPQPDFSDGSFRVKTSAKVLDFAKEYYRAIDQPGDTLYLQQFRGGGSRGFGGGSGYSGGGGGQGQFRGPGG